MPTSIGPRVRKPSDKAKAVAEALQEASALANQLNDVEKLKKRKADDALKPGAYNAFDDGTVPADGADVVAAVENNVANDNVADNNAAAIEGGLAKAADTPSVATAPLAVYRKPSNAGAAAAPKGSGASLKRAKTVTNTDPNPSKNELISEIARANFEIAGLKATVAELRKAGDREKVLQDSINQLNISLAVAKERFECISIELDRERARGVNIIPQNAPTTTAARLPSQPQTLLVSAAPTQVMETEAELGNSLSLFLKGASHICTHLPTGLGSSAAALIRTFLTSRLLVYDDSRVKNIVSRASKVSGQRRHKTLSTLKLTAEDKESVRNCTAVDIFANPIILKIVEAFFGRLTHGTKRTLYAFAFAQSRVQESVSEEGVNACLNALAEQDSIPDTVDATNRVPVSCQNAALAALYLVLRAPEPGVSVILPDVTTAPLSMASEDAGDLLE